MKGHESIVWLFDDPPMVDRKLAATGDEWLKQPPPPAPKEEGQLDISKETNTDVWYFWGSKKKKYTVSVFDLIYGEKLKLPEDVRRNLMARGKRETTTEEDKVKESLPKEDDQKKLPLAEDKELPYRWIHLPANNVRKFVFGLLTNVLT